MDNRKDTIEYLFNLCSLRIDHFNEKMILAIEDMEGYRCPLSSADSSLFDEMERVIKEYCEDNDIDYDTFDIDADEVFEG